MQLDVRGHPLHSRGQSITLVQRGDGKLDAMAELVDLRKRGFVPVCGHLQPAGVVHHMQLRGVVDPETLTLESLEAAMPTVAFEPSDTDNGESCRDPAPRLAALAGATLDAGFSRKLMGAFGGPSGCFHVLVLTQLLGSTAARAVAVERERFGGGPPRPTGETVFRRDLCVDGAMLTDRAMQLAVQLSDLHHAPVRGRVRPIERFAGQLETWILATVDLRSVKLSAVTAAERVRTLADLHTAEWRDRSTDVAQLVGLPLSSGVGPALLRHLGERPEDRPLLDGLLNLTPGMHQCMAVASERWNLSREVIESMAGMHGHADSCYMWRSGGAHDRLKKRHDVPESGGGE